MSRRPSAAITVAFGFLLPASMAGRGEVRRVPSGTWGAEGARLEVTNSGARVEYDCARGSIDQPLAVDSEGRLDVPGVFFRHQGAPSGGERGNGQEVRYRGRLSGDTLTLKVLLEGAEEPLASHILTRGKPGRVRKCM